jgi:hypothetical protein
MPVIGDFVRNCGHRREAAFTTAVYSAFEKWVAKDDCVAIPGKTSECPLCYQSTVKGCWHVAVLVCGIQWDVVRRQQVRGVRVLRKVGHPRAEGAVSVRCFCLSPQAAPVLFTLPALPWFLRQRLDGRSFEGGEGIA